MIEEAYPEAAEVLRAAGWAPHDLWGVYTRGTLVMGFQPDRSGFHVKNWGMDVHGPDTPDDPIEAAQWLVARFGEAHQDAAHETDSEIVPEAASDSDGDRRKGQTGAVPSHGADFLSQSEDTDFRSAAEPTGDDAGGNSPVSGPPVLGQEVLTTDAAFDEIAVEGADLLELPPPEPEDFAPDEIVPDKVAEAVAIFGDDLPMARLLLIGAVTRHAAGLKAILQEGWSVPEFAELQNQIMRMSEGLAPDDEHARARFAALSEASRAMSMIDAHAEAQVAFLEGASRDEIASYKPEENWP